MQIVNMTFSFPFSLSLSIAGLCPLDKERFEYQ